MEQIFYRLIHGMLGILCLYSDFENNSCFSDTSRNFDIWKRALLSERILDSKLNIESQHEATGYEGRVGQIWGGGKKPCRSRVSEVDIATGDGLDDRGVGVRVPGGSRIFSSPRRPDRPWGPPKLLSTSTGWVFSGGKSAG
jgi:hypothetical protein